MRSTRMAFMALLAASAGFAVPRAADACGGTFCDSGPRAMPVDQKGENIIFVMEPGKVEAHIQIQYKGDAHHFSWVLPVQALPEIEVGSEALFNRLLAATVPTFGYTTQRDACGVTGPGSTGTGGPISSGGAQDAGAARADGGVNIVLQQTVGAFDVTVLSGGTSKEVLDWLTANLYQTPPNAPALFDGYVANKYFFVAVKLTGGAGTDQIHPLVVRYDGTQPCVPLKLTAVAAVEDMGVRTFFLGTKRVVPRNWKHVVPNPLKLDWLRFGANYTDWVGRSVDSPVANGHAFVTEYAGPVAVVGVNPIAPPTWDASAFTGIAPTDVVIRLQQQGFLSCFTQGFTQLKICNYAHPLILPLLREFLPAPATLTLRSEAGTGSTITDPVAVEGYFYGCTSCYQDQIDMTAWSAAKFSSALASRIINPARHADALLSAWPYLTRMFTTISPGEMTEDPEFFEHDGLPNVKNSGSAVRRITCSGASGMTLPDNRPVALTPQSAWPGFASDMPWAERIEEFAASGDPLLLVDNTQKINSLLKAWNDSQEWPPANSPPGATTVGTGAGGVNATVGSGGVGSSGADTTGTGGAGGLTGNGLDPGASTTSSGCGCRTSGTHSPAGPLGAGAALFGAIALRRRTRREA
jgi:MYXO-CTERM domain-containing protein